MPIFTALAHVAFLLFVQQPPPAAAAVTDEDVLRAAVQEYYDAQARKDVDGALAFWSAAANPRPTREAFVAVFGDGEDQFTVEIQRVAIEGAEARVRVTAARTRLTMRDGRTATSRTVLRNSQRWRKEAAGWKLLRDGPFADEAAEEFIAAAPSERPALLEKYREDLRAVRYAIAERASMAVTLGGNHQQSKALFELALEVSRAAGDRLGELNSLHNIAQAAYFLRDHATAIDFYQRELAVAREVDNQDAIAAASFGLATVAYSRAEYTAALGFYRDALAVYEKQDHASAMGRAVVSIGNVQYLQAEYDAATASYRRALALLISGLDPQGATFARSGLARVFVAQGDLVAALDMYRQVLADARTVFAADPRTRSNVAAALESIGEVYFRLGNTETARTNVEEARKIAEADAESVGRLSGTLGLIELVAGRYEASLAAYTEMRTRYEKANKPDGVAQAWVGVGFSHAARERFADAMTAYRTAIRMFEAQKLNDESARAWLGLSLAQSGAKEHVAALESAQKVRIIADVMKNEDLKWRGAVRAGEAFRKLERTDDARQAFQLAVAAIDRLAAEAPFNPDRRGQLADSASAWTGLAMVLAANGDAAGALAAAEARRAHIRRVQFAGFQRDITKGATPEEIADEQAIVRELISTRAQLHAENNLRRPDAARLERLLQQQTALLSKREDQQARLYARLPELQEWRGLRPPLPAEISLKPGAAGAELVALVPDARTVIVEYLVSDEELLVLSVGRLRQGFGEQGTSAPGNELDIVATLVPSNRRELADKIAEAMKPAPLADAAEWRKLAAPLAATLIAPIASRLADRDRAIFIPDDLLWKVPFEALPAGDVALGQTTGVTYATSLATLAVQRRAAAARPAIERASAGIAAAPVIPDVIRTQLTLAQPGWKEPDAVASLATASALAKTYGDAAVVRSGAEATEPGTRALLETVDVLHIASPLQMAGATPLFSSLILGTSAGGEIGPENDGRWELREWFRVTGRARVLVLPDASSFGAAGVGGAMDALAWAAAAAGVPALIVGRWPAEGFGQEALLDAFHTHMAKGTPPGEAWRLATAAARNKNGAPTGWSGLRFIGGER
jgi:tetratricopeptide (TPR) repeat protein